MRTTIMILAGATALTLTQAATAATAIVTVAGTADPHLAGQPDGTMLAGDTAPDASPTVALTGFATGSAITFSGVGGFRNSAGVPYGLDGGGGFFNQNDAFGIAGLRNGQLNALIGVFLDASVPGGTAPAFRDLSVDGTGFATLSPLLNQVFFIGDGLTGTGSGAVQQFFAPTGATRLYLAPYDGSGGYYDNVGSATVTIDYTAAATPGLVPEPANWAMLLAGFGTLGAAVRRRRLAIRPASVVC